MEAGTGLPKNGTKPALNHIDKIYEEYTMKQQQNETTKVLRRYFVRGIVHKPVCITAWSDLFASIKSTNQEAALTSSLRGEGYNWYGNNLYGAWFYWDHEPYMSFMLNRRRTAI